MVVKAVENIMVSISTIAAMVFQNSAIVFTPLAPTIWTGAAFGSAITPMVGATMGTVLGIVLGVGMEGTGMLCFKAAQDEPRWYGKIYPVLYLAAGITISAVLKPEFFWVAVMLFLMVGLTYSVSSKNLKNQERKREAVENKRLALEARRKQAEQEAELLRREKDAEHELKMARLAAQKEIKMLESSGRLSGNFPAPVETSEKVPETFPRNSRRFRPEHWERLRNMDEAEIVLMAGVDIKTARAWLKKLEEVTQ
jgi:large-conductance mechanosensitive channel